MSVEALKLQLAAISSEYRRDLPARLARIEELWNDFAAGNATRVSELVRELHTIAGSAKTFGIAGVSEAAAAAEAYVERIAKRRKLPGAAQLAGFVPLLDALKQAAARGDA